MRSPVGSLCDILGWGAGYWEQGEEAVGESEIWGLIPGGVCAGGVVEGRAPPPAPHLGYALCGLVPAASASATLAQQLLNNNNENGKNIRGGETCLSQDPIVICFPV